MSSWTRGSVGAAANIGGNIGVQVRSWNVGRGLLGGRQAWPPLSVVGRRRSESCSHVR